MIVARITGIHGYVDSFFPTLVALPLKAIVRARNVNNTFLDAVHHLLANICLMVNFCFISLKTVKAPTAAFVKMGSMSIVLEIAGM